MTSTNCETCSYNFSNVGNYNKHCHTKKHTKNVLKCVVIAPVAPMPVAPVPVAPVVSMPEQITQYEQIIHDLTQQLAEANRQLAEYKKPKTDGYDTDVEEDPVDYGTDVEEDPVDYATDVEEDPSDQIIEKINNISEDIIEQSVMQCDFDYDTASKIDAMCRDIVNEIVSQITPVKTNKKIEIIKPDKTRPEINTIRAEYDCFNIEGNLTIMFVSGEKKSTPIIHENFKLDPNRQIDIQILEFAREDLRTKYMQTKIKAAWNLATFDNMQILVFTDNHRPSQPCQTITPTLEQKAEMVKSDKKH